MPAWRKTPPHTTTPPVADEADDASVQPAEQIEADVRNLMAMRAAMPDDWQWRVKRRELLGEIDEALDHWLAMEANS